MAGFTIRRAAEVIPRSIALRHTSFLIWRRLPKSWNFLPMVMMRGSTARRGLISQLAA